MAVVADCGTNERLPDILTTDTRTRMVDVVNSKPTVLEQIAQRIDNLQARQLLIKCLSIDPNARPDATEIAMAMVRTCLNVYIHMTYILLVRPYARGAGLVRYGVALRRRLHLCGQKLGWCVCVCGQKENFLFSLSCYKSGEDTKFQLAVAT